MEPVRRQFLMRAGMLSLGLFVPGSLPLRWTNVPRGQNTHDLKSLMAMSPVDKLDQNISYLAHWDGTEWYQMVDVFFKEVLFRQDMPEGWIVEIGTHKAVSFNKLCDHFGAKRCIGFDAFSYVQHPFIVQKDIRSTNMSDFDRPIAFGWSNASNWEGSPRSKFAALNYLTRNIVKGGYLLEDSLPDVPRDIGFPNFREVWKNNRIVLLQKIA